MGLVVAAALTLVLQTTAAAQTSVFVKFLNPPHGYSHNLHVSSKGGVAVATEQRIYPSDFLHSRLQQTRYQQPQQLDSYVYPRPSRPFEDYGPPPLYLEEGPPHEPFQPNGEYHNPARFVSSQRQSEVTYDPNLITGPQASQYVKYLFSRGELFFDLIPHERLVLMNQQERVENNLLPHILASIRPGHPFFHR